VDVSNECDFEYDVALSFAGADRKHAEALASLLKASNVRVFYDADEKATLWGKDLYAFLHEVYSKKARFCIVFVSADYVEKIWTNHERQAAQERAIKERGNAYILPIRLDNTPLPGLPETIASVDISEGIPAIARLVLEKTGEGAKAPLFNSEPARPLSDREPPLPTRRWLALAGAVVLLATGTAVGVLKSGPKGGSSGTDPTAAAAASSSGPPASATQVPMPTSVPLLPQVLEAVPPLPHSQPPTTARSQSQVQASDGLDWLRARVKARGVTFYRHGDAVMMSCTCVKPHDPTRPLQAGLGPYLQDTEAARQAIYKHATDQLNNELGSDCKQCQ